MRTYLIRIMILLAVMGLICAPPLLTGYASLRVAERASRSSDAVLAANSYEKAARLLPWKPELWELAGLARYQDKDCEGAIRFFEIARKRETLSAAGWEGLGVCYFEIGNPEAAITTWEAGVRAYPAHTEFYPHLVGMYRALGDQESEKEALERWIANGGRGEASAHYRLGQLLTLLDPKRAMDEYLMAASLDPKYDPAAQTMRTTLNLASLESEESRRMVIIGRGLGLLNEWQLASQAFQQAVSADREAAQAWAWLGEAKQQLGQEGRAELDTALSLDRRDSVVRSLRGLYWIRQGDYDQALKEYSTAASYDPGNPVWQVSIGEAYSQKGDLQAALGAYIKATEMAPNDPTYLRLLAAFSAHYNMQVENVGLPAARLAIDLAPEDPRVLDVLGWTYLVLERLEEAEYQFERALQFNPDYALGHLHAGMVASRLDDWQSAREHWQRAYDLDVGGSVGEQAQRLLNQYFP